MPFKYTVIAATDSPVKADALMKIAERLGLYVNILESISVTYSKEQVQRK